MTTEIATETKTRPTLAKRSRFSIFRGFSVRWIPSSFKQVLESERRLLTLVKAPFVQEQTNIGPGLKAANPGWFRSSKSESYFINTITFECTGPDADPPTLVLLHGYGGAQGFYFRNFDALALRFRVIAIDQLGWGASGRPDFTCKSTEDADRWFIDSMEEWRKAKGLDKFILLGHSLGGYVAAKYALEHSEHVQHLILVGPAGFCEQSDKNAERLVSFGSSWQRLILGHLWESNFTPQMIIRGLGPLGPNVIRRFTTVRFLSEGLGDKLNKEEFKLLSDYIYHTVAGKPSGEHCLNYIYSFGAFTRKPLLKRASEWKVPTTFIYGCQDWENYTDAQEARKDMNVPVDIIRIQNGGHLVFMENPSAFHAAVFSACQNLSTDFEHEALHEDLAKV